MSEFLNGPFIVKVARRLCEVIPGVTKFDTLLVLRRLPATVSAQGDIKALWRVECLVCGRQTDRDLANGKKPRCLCVDRDGDPKHMRQVLQVLAATEAPFLSLRAVRDQISDFGTEYGIQNERALRGILKDLLKKKRVKQVRNEQSRGYCIVRKDQATKQEPTKVVADTPSLDECLYEDPNEEIQEEPE